MRFLSVAVATLGISLIGGASALSQGMVHGVVHSATTKARCTPGDPNVLMNGKTKTYVLDTTATRAALTRSGNLASMKSLCKSEAEGMGAHLMSNAMTKKPT